MTFRQLLLTLVVLLFPSLFAPAAFATEDERSTAEAAAAEDRLNIEELAPGVWAVLQPAANRFNDSNSVVIDLGSDLLVVDSQSDGEHVEALISWLRETSEKPVRFLVNTHWHGDHVQGNAAYRQAFGKTLQIIGHRSLREDVPGRAATGAEEQAGRYETAIAEAKGRLEKGEARDGSSLDDSGKEELARQIDHAKNVLAGLRAASFVAPDLTYERRLDFHRNGRTVELHHFRAHTRGDTVLFLPQEKILITGDLLDDLPYGGHGYPTEWIKTLETLETFDFETLVPGHGPVFKGKEQLHLILALVRSIVSQTETAVANGKTLEETQESLDLSTFREQLAGDDAVAQRNFEHFMPETIARAWAEAQGELTDEPPEAH